MSAVHRVSISAMVGLLLLAAPSFAHHSFALEFDGKKCREFTGTLTRLDLIAGIIAQALESGIPLYLYVLAALLRRQVIPLGCKTL